MQHEDLLFNIEHLYGASCSSITLIKAKPDRINTYEWITSVDGILAGAE